MRVQPLPHWGVNRMSAIDSSILTALTVPPGDLHGNSVPRIVKMQIRIKTWLQLFVVFGFRSLPCLVWRRAAASVSPETGLQGRARE